MSLLVSRRGTLAPARVVATPPAAAPTFVAASASPSASQANTAVPVPAGVAIGDVVLITSYYESPISPSGVPTGFTELTFGTVPGGTIAAGWAFYQKVWWKRLTAADTGSYTFTHAALYTQFVATAYRGCVATGTPVEVLGSGFTSANSTSFPSVSGTTAGANRLVVWQGVAGDLRTITPPTGYTERFDDGNGTGVATVTQAASGTTGAVVGTMSAAVGSSATLLGLIPA